MNRRNVEIFNLSFLDILAGALGAVLFLFIVVPKGGGSAPPASPQLSVNFDTVQMKFFGELPDSMVRYTVGDSLLSLVINYDRMPSILECPEPRPCPKCPDVSHLKREIRKLNKALATTKREEVPARKASEKSPAVPPKPREITPTAAATPVEKSTSKYKGDMPSVPCKFSVEVAWDDIEQNVDLFVCRDGRCVYGGKRKRDGIGFWDSGKSKTSIFGGDLRSTQEAVRQFDSVIEGEYEIYAQYKADANEPDKSVMIRTLIYTNTIESGEQGQTFDVDLPFDRKNRTLLGRLSVNTDGSFTFQKEV